MRIKMTKKCGLCGKEFNPWNSVSKFCSYACSNGRRTISIPPIKCVVCKKMFAPYQRQASIGLRPMKYCSRKCYFEHEKESRKGKNNPAYRNGSRVGGKSDFDSRKTEKYRKNFLSKTTYPFCEECGVNQSLRWEIHHIVFRSEMPSHKYLHDLRNLIHVCINCHNNFHKGGCGKKRLHLVEERGLVKLFGRIILFKK